METSFYQHAEHKFRILAEHGFTVTRQQVVDTVRKPTRVLPGRQGRKIAEAAISDTHKLRVIFEETGDSIAVVTFYPRRIAE